MNREQEQFSLQTTKWSIQCLYLHSDGGITMCFSKAFQKMTEQYILETLCNKIVDVVRKKNHN